MRAAASERAKFVFLFDNFEPPGVPGSRVLLLMSGNASTNEAGGMTRREKRAWRNST